MSTSPTVPSAHRALLDARESGRCALIPYLTLGYPSLAASLELLDGLESLGVDAVEVGIPFSDPVADGPVIQRTIDHALREGVTLRRGLGALSLRTTSGGPRVLFSYLNPLLALGWPALPPALGAAGVGAVLVTDLTVEEAGDWLEVAAARSIESCFLVASTSSAARLQQAAEHSSGFVYCVATLGVTGSRTSLDESARDTVRRLREASGAPVAVGFGLSGPDDVRRVREFADGAVVGSALMTALGDATDPAEVCRRGVEFIRPLLEAAHG